MKSSSAIAVATFLSLVGVGCAQRFTHDRFEMIQPGADGRADVKELLGEPRFNAGDQWYYEDMDRQLSALVYFGADGRVSGTEWIDGGADSWEGTNPHAAAAPAGDSSSRTVRSRRIDTD